jgi:hypothetical protein
MTKLTLFSYRPQEAGHFPQLGVDRFGSVPEQHPANAVEYRPHTGRESDPVRVIVLRNIPRRKWGCLSLQPFCHDVTLNWSSTCTELEACAPIWNVRRACCMGGGGSHGLGRTWCVWVYGKSYDPGSHQVFSKFGVQEETVVVSFRFYSDTDIPVNTVRMVKEAFQLLGSMKPSTYRNQQGGLWVSQSRAISLHSPVQKLTATGESSDLFVELTAEAEGRRKASKYLPLSIDLRHAPPPTSRVAYYLILEINTICSSETSGSFRTTRRYSPDDRALKIFLLAS